MKVKMSEGEVIEYNRQRESEKFDSLPFESDVYKYKEIRDYRHKNALNHLKKHMNQIKKIPVERHLDMPDLVIDYAAEAYEHQNNPDLVDKYRSSDGHLILVPKLENETGIDGIAMFIKKDRESGKNYLVTAYKATDNSIESKLDSGDWERVADEGKLAQAA